MAGKIRNVLAFYSLLRNAPNVDLRFHRTTLYNSIYRFDEEMLVNTHVFGFPAAHAPVLHLRRLSGGDLFDTYADSVDRVWSTGLAAWPPAWQPRAMPRTEYFNDPNAPEPNAIVVAVTAFVVDAGPPPTHSPK